MTYRQESEKDEEHALICLSAPKQMKHSQEPETDEEQTLIYLSAPNRCSIVKSLKRMKSAKKPFYYSPNVLVRT